MNAQTLKTVARDPVVYLAPLLATVLFCCLSLTIRYEASDPAEALAMVTPAAIHLTQTAHAAIDE